MARFHTRCSSGIENDHNRTLMTNSGKYALYSPGLLDVHVAYGSLEDCIESAVAGKVVRSPSPWDA